MRFPKLSWMQLRSGGCGLALLAVVAVAIGQDKKTDSGQTPSSKKSQRSDNTDLRASTADEDPFDAPTKKNQAGRSKRGGGSSDPFDSGGVSSGGGGGSAFGGGGFSPGGFGGDAFGSGFGGMGGQANGRLVQGSGLMISWSKNHDQLRGFSVSTGNWTPLNIKKQKTIVPVVGDSVAAVRVGDSMAAYSSKTGTWDVLRLARQSKAVPVVHTRLITVNDNGFLYTFAADSARWTSPDDPKMTRTGPTAGATGPRNRSQTQSATDPDVVSIVSEFRGGKLTKLNAIAAVRRAVSDEFDRRQATHIRQAAKLREKLERLDAAIKQRANNRNSIVERRVQQLLNTPASNSQTDSAGAASQSISR